MHLYLSSKHVCNVVLAWIALQTLELFGLSCVHRLQAWFLLKNWKMFKESAVCKARFDYYIIAFLDIFALSVWSGLGWRCRSISHTSRLGIEFFRPFVYNIYNNNIYIYYIIYIYIHILWLYMTMLFSKHVAAKAWNSKLQVSAKQGIAGFIGCKAKRTRLRMASFCFVAFVQRISKCADWWLLPESAGTLITKWWAWKSFSALGQGQRCSGDDALVNFGRREDAAGSNSAMKPCLVP